MRKRREFEVHVRLSTSIFDDNLHEKFVETKVRQLLETLGQFQINSFSVIERRNKPTLARALRQFKFGIHGGWLLHVPLEIVAFGKDPKVAQTMDDAIAKCIADGATVHVATEGFVVMRLERGKYLSIGMHDGKVWSTRVWGNYAKPSTRKQTRAPNSR